jgi:hypothetical protein
LPSGTPERVYRFCFFILIVKIIYTQPLAALLFSVQRKEAKEMSIGITSFYYLLSFFEPVGTSTFAEK